MVEFFSRRIVFIILWFQSLLDFGLHAPISATFCLWGETGSKSRKQLIKSFGGWGGVTGFGGG